MGYRRRLRKGSAWEWEPLAFGSLLQVTYIFRPWPHTPGHAQMYDLVCQKHPVHDHMVTWWPMVKHSVCNKA